MVEGFERVADASEILVGTMKIFTVGGKEVMVTNVNGSFYALPNKCTHVGGPLGRGRLSDSIVQCPWHGSKFDVRTGAVVQGPAQKPEVPVEVRVENNAVWIKRQ